MSKGRDWVTKDGIIKGAGANKDLITRALAAMAGMGSFRIPAIKEGTKAQLVGTGKADTIKVLIIKDSAIRATPTKDLIKDLVTKGLVTMGLAKLITDITGIMGIMGKEDTGMAVTTKGSIAMYTIHSA